VVIQILDFNTGSPPSGAPPPVASRGAATAPAVDARPTCLSPKLADDSIANVRGSEVEAPAARAADGTPVVPRGIRGQAPVQIDLAALLDGTT